MVLFVKIDVGNRYILIIMDYLSGWFEFYFIFNKINEVVWKVFREEFFFRYGFSEVLITDNGVEFIVVVFEGYLKGVGVEYRIIIFYYLCLNGRSERFYRTLKVMLVKMICG